MSNLFVALAAKPMVALLLCLGVGFLAGRIKLGRFPNNATLGTIAAAIALNLLIRGAGAAIEKPTLDLLGSLFFALFTFALGYGAGPGFVNSLRRDGPKTVLKQAVLCVFYCACVLGVMLLVSRLSLVEGKDSLNGLLAGAQTQSTILSDSLKGGGQMVAYAVSYVIGTALMILFVQRVAPALLKITPRAAVKQYRDRLRSGAQSSGQIIPTRFVQLRAYRVLPGAHAVGKTVEALEAEAHRRMEVVALFRGDAALTDLGQKTEIAADDVLVVLGDARVIRDVRGNLIEETAEDRYLTAELKYAEIVITEKSDKLSAHLTGLGVLVQSVQRRGRVLSPQEAGAIQPDDIVSVAGLSRSVDEIANRYGYIKENGAASNIAVMMLAIAAAAVIGGISFSRKTPVSLGTGCCAIAAGMICGVINQRRPRRAYVPAATLAFARSLGLNLFIASVTLTARMDPADIFSLSTLRVLLCAVGVALVPAALSLFFGRRVLKLEPVELLGGLCGCATCTAALNALEEETESSAFTASYTPAYVAGNILLTLTGVLLTQVF